MFRIKEKLDWKMRALKHHYHISVVLSVHILRRRLGVLHADGNIRLPPSFCCCDREKQTKSARCFFIQRMIYFHILYVALIIYLCIYILFNSTTYYSSFSYFYKRTPRCAAWWAKRQHSLLAIQQRGRGLFFTDFLYLLAQSFWQFHSCWSYI